MWNVAFRTFGASVRGFAHNLFVPFRPGRIGLMAADAVAVIEYLHLYFGVVGVGGMGLARAVAGLARESLVLVLLQFLDDLGMTLVARLLAGVNTVARGHFRERSAAIPPVFPKRRRC